MTEYIDNIFRFVNNFVYNITNVSDKDVIEINIIEAPNRPYYLANKDIKTSGVYLRYATTSAPASEEVIKKMLIENQEEKYIPQIF